MTDLERFIAICRTVWGNEWHRHAADHLGKSRRTIVYWANGTFPPKEGWAPVFTSLLAAVNDALQDSIIRKQRLIEFKRTYAGAGR